MNLLYSSLKSIYDHNTHYHSFVPLEPLHYSIRDFLLKNIKNGNLTIDPLDFSYDYSLDTIRVLDTFLLLSEYGVLIKQYHLICDECGTPTIEADLEVFYECIQCKYLLLNLSKPVSPNIFNNIKYVFEINEDVTMELRSDIKNLLPSSSFNSFDEEGDSTNNVSSVLNNRDKTLKGITIENEILIHLSEGILNIS